VLTRDECSALRRWNGEGVYAREVWRVEKVECGAGSVVCVESGVCMEIVWERGARKGMKGAILGGTGRMFCFVGNIFFRVCIFYFQC
jgi:hypothetical protein